MKVLSNLRILFMLVAATLMITSCADDLGDGTGGGGGTTNPLTLSISNTSDVSVPLGGTFSINLVATAGDEALRDIEVFEDGISITEFTRISYNGEVAAANPRLLFNDEKSNFDYNIEVVAHTGVGTRSYTFVVTDEAGDSDNRSVEITTTGIPPALALNGSSTLELDAGGLTNVNLSAVKGSGSFVSIGLAIDGVVDNFEDLAFAGVECTSNPHLIGGDLAEGFDGTPFTFRAPSEDGSYVYVITLTDEFGLESNVQFTVVVSSLESFNGVLFNAGGPAGTGGLDLDLGIGTPSDSIAAEIIDLGIDVNGNWIQQIAPANDALLYKMIPGEDGVSENFTFSSIDSKATLAGLVGSGFAASASGTVLVGDVYVVVRDGINYAFEVVEVNVIAADNSDNYVLNIVK